MTKSNADGRCLAQLGQALSAPPLPTFLAPPCPRRIAAGRWHLPIHDARPAAIETLWLAHQLSLLHALGLRSGTDLAARTLVVDGRACLRPVEQGDRRPPASDHEAARRRDLHALGEHLHRALFGVEPGAPLSPVPRAVLPCPTIELADALRSAHPPSAEEALRALAEDPLGRARHLAHDLLEVLPLDTPWLSVCRPLLQALSELEERGRCFALVAEAESGAARLLRRVALELCAREILPLCLEGQDPIAELATCLGIEQPSPGQRGLDRLACCLAEEAQRRPLAVLVGRDSPRHLRAHLFGVLRLAAASAPVLGLVVSEAPLGFGPMANRLRLQPCPVALRAELATALKLDPRVVAALLDPCPRRIGPMLRALHEALRSGHLRREAGVWTAEAPPPLGPAARATLAATAWRQGPLRTAGLATRAGLSQEACVEALAELAQRSLVRRDSEGWRAADLRLAEDLVPRNALSAEVLADPRPLSPRAEAELAAVLGAPPPRGEALAATIEARDDAGLAAALRALIPQDAAQAAAARHHLDTGDLEAAAALLDGLRGPTAESQRHRLELQEGAFEANSPEAPRPPRWQLSCAGLGAVDALHAAWARESRVPERARLLQSLATRLLRAGRWSDAAEALAPLWRLRAALGDETGARQAALGLGRATLELDQRLRAEEIALTWLARGADPEASSLLGEVLLQRGDLVGSEHALERAEAGGSPGTRHLYRRTLLDLAAGRPDAALSRLDEAAVSLHDPTLMRLRARALKDCGRGDAAQWAHRGLAVAREGVDEHELALARAELALLSREGSGAELRAARQSLGELGARAALRALPTDERLDAELLLALAREPSAEGLLESLRAWLGGHHAVLELCDAEGRLTRHDAVGAPPLWWGRKQGPEPGEEGLPLYTVPIAGRGGLRGRILCDTARSVSERVLTGIGGVASGTLERLAHERRQRARQDLQGDDGAPGLRPGRRTRGRTSAERPYASWPRGHSTGGALSPVGRPRGLDAAGSGQHDPPMKSPGRYTDTQDSSPSREDLLKRSADQEEVLLEIALQFGATLDLERLLPLVLDRITNLLHADRAVCALLDEKQMVERAVLHNLEWPGSPEPLPISQGLLQEVIETRRAVVVADTANNANFGGRDSVRLLGLRFLMGVPIHASGRVIGVLYVDSRAQKLHSLDSETRLLEAIGRLVGTAVENARLFSEQRYRTRLLETLVHDFRAPLAVILANAEMLAAEPDEEDAEEMARDVAASAQRMTSMVDNTLELSRMETGSDSDPQELHLQQALPEHLRPLRTVAAAHEVDFALEMEPMLPPAMTVPDRVWIILDNLLLNALKYAPGRTTITVTARLRSDLGPTEASERPIGEINMLGRLAPLIPVHDSPFVEITVHNLGAAIPEELQPKLFEAYTRGQGSRRWRSTGLGLSIVHQCARHLGGAVWVRSAADEGTTFVFTLPTVLTSMESTQPSMRVGRDTQPMPALVVDARG